LKRELRGELVTVELKAAAEGDATDVVGALEGVNDVLTEGYRLFARVDHGAEAVPTILGALDDAGVEVAAVTVSRPSLDDVYLHYTGRDFRSDDEAGR